MRYLYFSRGNINIKHVTKLVLGVKRSIRSFVRGEHRYYVNNDAAGVKCHMLVDDADVRYWRRVLIPAVSEDTDDIYEENLH